MLRASDFEFNILAAYCPLHAEKKPLADGIGRGLWSARSSDKTAILLFHPLRLSPKNQPLIPRGTLPRHP